MTRFTEPVWYLSPALASAQCQDSWRWQPTVTCLTVLQSAEQFVLAIRCYNFIFPPPTHETMNYFVWNKEQRPYIANKSILLANNSASLIFVKSSHNVWKVSAHFVVVLSTSFRGFNEFLFAQNSRMQRSKDFFLCQHTFLNDMAQITIPEVPAKPSLRLVKIKTKH